MKRTENKCAKRTWKDNPMFFKLSVVREYEEKKVLLTDKNKDPELLVFREKMNVLERKNAILEKKLAQKDMKA